MCNEMDDMSREAGYQRELSSPGGSALCRGATKGGNVSDAADLKSELVSPGGAVLLVDVQQKQIRCLKVVGAK